jgi:serine/threonine protein kinase
MGYDQKCDIWALGVVTFELFVGSPPFSNRADKDYDRIMQNIMNVIS